jgi:hypothetical protein
VDPLLVFLVPLGGQRYELYCERHHTGPDEVPTGSGWLAGVRQKFSAMLKRAEESEDEAPPSAGAMARLQAWMMAWVAERVAEQRLLWNLRGRDAAIVTHPDDLPFDQVMDIVRQSLRADHRRHTRWLVVDTVLFIGSGIFFFIPGPNLIAYFFAFRLVGHWLSMRGAAHGRDTTSWTGRPSTALARLRAAVSGAAPHQDETIAAVARELDLHRLETFLDRMLKPHQAQSPKPEA